jgi:MFS family permease
MDDSRLQFTSLYVAKFAGSFGVITLLTLLPTYIDLFDPSGVVIGLFTTAFTLAQTVAIVPLGWAGDRYDKRTILLAALGGSIVAYAAFPFVGDSLGFIAARTLQGLCIVGAAMLTLALVGELAPADARANRIGRLNSWRMAAGIAGTLGAGVLYERFGFDVIFGLIGALLTVAFVGVWLFVDSDDTSVSGFAFSDLAFNRRILTLTSFRSQYAVAVTLVRTWVPIYAGVSASKGGLAVGATVVGVVIAAEKFTNMLCQPYTGRLSDRTGRAKFVFLGGGMYGLVALAVPFSPAIGAALPFPAQVPVLGALPAAIFPLILLNALLGVADSIREPASMALFADEGVGSGIASSLGIRNLVWRPGNVLAPMLGGYLMTGVGMEWVFYVGGAFAVTGVLTFFGVLSYNHGNRALAEW